MLTKFSKDMSVNFQNYCILIAIILSMVFSLGVLTGCLSPLEKHLSRGVNAYANGNYEEAIIEYTKAIEIDPKNKGAYYFRGFSYFKNGQYDLAIVDFTKDIEINPRSPNAYAARGFLYSITDQNYLAIVDYNQAIAIDPRNPNFYNERANLYIKAGDISSAISDLKKVLELSNEPQLIQSTKERLESLGQ
jgi:tetratricopeptide (TPR) repeat protein